MFTGTRVCLSALTKRTKRTKVQILRDFPTFQLFKGEVIEVKPSLMRNYLYNDNGARYILSDDQIDANLYDDFVKLKAEREMKKKAVHKPVKTKEKKKEIIGILDNDITIDDVFIPGLKH